MWWAGSQAAPVSTLTAYFCNTRIASPPRDDDSGPFQLAAEATIGKRRTSEQVHAVPGPCARGA
jgi:hypothetical protein